MESFAASQCNGSKIFYHSHALTPTVRFCRYQVQSTRTFVTDLIIDNVSLDDSGVYTCRTASKQVVDTTKVTVVRCKYIRVIYVSHKI